MTRYVYDTEFIEDGFTIELISIGIVADDGREYYAVNADMPTDRIFNHTWLHKNVWPSLPVQMNGTTPTIWLDLRSALVKPKWVIANEVRDFLLAGSEPQLWADYSAYDHVALCQLWGKMIDLPTGIPMFTNDIQQALHANVRARSYSKPEQDEGEHNALADARHGMMILQGLIDAGGLE